MQPIQESPKSCSVEGCGLTYFSRGYCTKHWRELWRAEVSDDQLGYRYQTLQDAFEAWPVEISPDGCHIWVGNTSGYAPGQYGVLTFRNKRWFAHRVAYELRHGPIPRGMDIDHLCHVRLCVNVDHLRMTTHKQNLEHRSGANANSHTGHRGITYDKARNQYRARVKHNYEEIHVGRFDTLEEALAAVAEKRRELFTHSNHDTA
jgi:hypothetical protein